MTETFITGNVRAEIAVYLDREHRSSTTYIYGVRMELDERGRPLPNSGRGLGWIVPREYLKDYIAVNGRAAATDLLRQLRRELRDLLKFTPDLAPRREPLEDVRLVPAPLPTIAA